MTTLRVGYCCARAAMEARASSVPAQRARIADMVTPREGRLASGWRRNDSSIGAHHALPVDAVVEELRQLFARRGMPDRLNVAGVGNYPELFRLTGALVEALRVVQRHDE